MNARHGLVALVAACALAACGDDLDATGDIDTSADTSPDAVDASGDADTGTDAADDVLPTDATADADTTEPPPEPVWCDGATAHRYTPFEADSAELFPDGLMVRDDPTSPTGERLDFTDETTPWLSTSPPLVQGIAESFSVLSGYGGLGGTLLRFHGPVTGLPTTGAESVESTAWIWADLSTEPPTRIPFDARTFDDGETVVLWPMIPLRPGTPHAIVVTTDAVAADGGCIAPAPATRSLLFGDADEGPWAPWYERARPRYRAAVEALGLDLADVSVISAYGTHDDLGPVLRVAETMNEAPVEWGEWQGCEARETMWECETSTTVLDTRNERGLVDDTIEPVEASVPVRVWLPQDVDGPVPVLVFGHGLQQSRGDGWLVASRVQGDGVAVVAMPAVEHGEHPSVTPDDAAESLLRFLALDLNSLTIDGFAMRGNINQTNLDRLRLIRLLRTRPDLDGDGVDDIDPDRVTYIGASLGAVLGPGLLALSPDLDAAVLTIGGARLVSLLRDQDDLLEQYAPFVELLLGPGELDRLLPLAQHAVDPADPGTWAPYVLHDRFDGRTPPSVLLAVGLEDEVFSPDSGNTLARAMGVPQVGPIVAEVEGLERAGEAPIAGNAEGGTRTVGFFQYDRITRDDDPDPRRPRHEASARSNESGVQLRAFFEAWANDGLPAIIDPFALLETAPRPAEWDE